MKDLPGPTIEPDPDGGYKPAPRVFLWAGLALVLIWAGFLYSFAPDWKSVGLGLFTGIVIASWGAAVDDGKTAGLFKPRKRVHPWPPRHWRR